MIAFHHGGNLVQVPWGGTWVDLEKRNRMCYRDTPESTLRQLIRQIDSGEPWREVIRRQYECSYPWLHRIVTDPCRDLFFRMHPPKRGSIVLDIGAGWGQISIPLAQEHHVVALEPTPERLAFIQSVANQERVTSRMIFLESDFLETKFHSEFDLVSCIGVLEWVPKFASGDPRAVQQQFLSAIREALTPDGTLVVGIENRIGLKYLLGSADDHIGSPNIAVFDAELAQRRFRALTGSELRSFTYSLAEYQQLFTDAGFGAAEVFVAFPDYKVPALIHPANEDLESKLAGVFEVPHEHDGSNGTAVSAEFQECLTSHYRTFARNGVSRFFAPSYYFRVRKR